MNHAVSTRINVSPKFTRLDTKMSFFGWGRSNGGGSGSGGAGGLGAEQPGRNLQDGLFQIASQACHILVQVNNTHNVSYGGSNNVTNVAYSKHSAAGGPSSSASSAAGGSSSSRSYPGQSTPRGKDQDVVVLLPQHKSRTPRIRHKLSTVSENARLDVNSPGGGDDDMEMWDQSGFMLRGDGDDPLTNTKWGAQGWCRPSCIPITVILILIVLVVLLPLLDHAADKHPSNSTNYDNNSGQTCMDSCRINLVESIPIGLVYPNNSVSHPSTYHTWMELIASAQSSIEITAAYVTMRREDVYPGDSPKQGEDVFEALLEAGRDRGVRLRFVQNIPTQPKPNVDSEYLSKKANAQVRSLNFPSLLGAGYMHTKLWLIDRTHVYIGSANMDWRALTQFKELGLLAVNCSCLAKDIAKIFDVYWKLSEDRKVPSTWPESLATNINMKNPMNFTLDDNKYRAFLASSPPALSPKGRTDDLDAIIHCIDKAERFINIAVTSYFPLTIYTAKIKYWPIIDDALRTAAIEHKVHIRLLISWWKHSESSQDYFLTSLAALTRSYRNVKVEVKLFIVPTSKDTDNIPYTKLNHNKYLVTDVAAYIGTSNWSGDYFIDNAGIGLVFEDVGHKNTGSIRQQLGDIFHRDWTSEYAHSLNTTYSDRHLL